MSTFTAQSDVYQTVTDSIVAMLEKGTRPWMKPWGASEATLRPLRVTGEPYQGINVILLWMASEAKGYRNATWMTYAHAAKIGGQVRRGEKGTSVTFAKSGKFETENDDGEMEEHGYFSRKLYTVFNVEQIDNLPAKFYLPATKVVVDLKQQDAGAEAFFANLGANIKHDGTKAFYAPSKDTIQMPAFKLFKDAVSYYATLAHECIHWTKHPSRLDRDMGARKMGDIGYALEELVAEIGSCFISADLGLQITPREDHADYVAFWLKALRDDKRAIFTAASAAQKAANFLNSRQVAQLKAA